MIGNVAVNSTTDVPNWYGALAIVLATIFVAPMAHALDPYVSVQVADVPNESSTSRGLGRSRSERGSDASLWTEADSASGYNQATSPVSGLRASQYHVRGVMDLYLLNYAADETELRKGETLTMAGLRYKPTVDFKMYDWLSWRATAKLWLAQGYAESRLGNFVPPQSFSLFEGYVEARPVDYFSFRAGAINQSNEDLHNEILIGDSVYPAVVETFHADGDLLAAELTAQQAVPTSTTLSTDAVNAEPMPTFFVETLTLKTAPVKSVEGHAYVTKFQFNDLGTVVAAASEPRGNTVNESGPLATKFRYQFAGMIYGLGGRVDLARKVSLRSNFEFIDNMAAPETYNRGESGYLALDVRLPDEIVLKPRVDLFFLESDAAPAYWLESFYGSQTNRSGYSAEMGADFTRQKFSMALRYMSFRPINANQWQSPEQLVFLQFRTRHDLL